MRGPAACSSRPRDRPGCAPFRAPWRRPRPSFGPRWATRWPPWSPSAWRPTRAAATPHDRERHKLLKIRQRTGDTMRILIAEDDQVLADGLLRTLRSSGAVVDHVASGSEADAALMTNNEFDLLILDLGLPRMHGLEVSNNATELYIHRLRKKNEKGPIRIATVRGLGYCLEKIPG